MKKILALVSVLALCSSLLACAPASSSGEKVKVKCPACGYEFEVPAPRP